MMPKIEGSCLCGSIKFTCSSEPLFSALCHCSACQKSTGSAFSVVVGAKKADLVITGNTLRNYDCIGDSGNPLSRHFCSNCGTTLFGEMISRPDVTFVKAGTLDDASWVKPQMNAYWRDHCSWISEIDSLPKYETMPKRK
jgi:hypothetical protein